MQVEVRTRTEVPALYLVFGPEWVPVGTDGLPLNSVADALRNTSELAGVLAAHLQQLRLARSVSARILREEGRYADQIFIGWPEVTYLHAESPVSVVLTWVTRGINPASWIDMFADFLAAALEFPGSVRRARYERMTAEVEAQSAFEAALLDQATARIARLQSANNRAKLLQVETGELLQLVHQARSSQLKRDP